MSKQSDWIQVTVATNWVWFKYQFLIQNSAELFGSVWHEHYSVASLGPGLWPNSHFNSQRLIQFSDSHICCLGMSPRVHQQLYGSLSQGPLSTFLGRPFPVSLKAGALDSTLQHITGVSGRRTEKEKKVVGVCSTLLGLQPLCHHCQHHQQKITLGPGQERMEKTVQCRKFPLFLPDHWKSPFPPNSELGGLSWSCVMPCADFQVWLLWFQAREC